MSSPTGHDPGPASTDTTPPDSSAGYHALRTSAAAHALARDVVRLSGPDTLTYLQGQCSQDVSGLVSGEAVDALLLSPQGKVEALVRVTRTGDEEVVLDVDAGAGEAVKARLERFRLRVKTTVELVEGWACVAVRGPRAGDGSLLPAATEGRGVLRLPVSWPGLSGFDLLGPRPEAGEPLEAWIAADVVRCRGEAWEAARIEAGIPAQGREITEATIAAEVGLVDRSVSFTKGCFTGQELVARLDARGSKVARIVRGVVVGAPGGGSSGRPDPDVPPVGATVVTADGEHEVGHLTSVAWSPGLGAAVGLAVLHRRVTPPETVAVRWSGDDGTHERTAEVRELPLVGPGGPVGTPVVPKGAAS